MVKNKKQQLAVGGLTSLFSSSSSNKQQETCSTPGAVLPCHSSSWSMSSSSSYSAWQWTSCGLHPRTLSFRQQQQEDANNGHGCKHHDNDMVMTKQQAYYKTMNSAFSIDSCFSTNSLASIDTSFSTASDDAVEAEAVIRAARSDRLLFEPKDDASSFKAASKKPVDKLIIQQAVDEEDDRDTSTTMSKAATAAFGGAMAMSVDSQNPYQDFRESMEAMVMSQQGGVKDWRWLEEMLGWYLRANGKSTHGLIVGAFVDLLVALSAAASPADSSSSPVTPAAAKCSSSSDCSCCSSSSF